jgi:transposase
MDLGKKESQIAVTTEAGELIEKRTRTERERLREFFAGRAKARILMEASTISEWVARLLEELGHEVVVADPNYAPMYAQRSRRVKTDRRDARALAEACRLGAYRPAHRVSEEQHHVRVLLAVREKLVRTRAGLVTLAQALLSREGIRVPSGSSERFGSRVDELELNEALRGEIAPLLALLVPLNERIDGLDERLGALAARDERVSRLLTMPQIGPVTALSFVATLDEVVRFRGAHQVEAYLGLVPREWSSSELQREGGSPRPATPGCAGCWWRQHGAWLRTRRDLRRSCFGTGRSGSRGAAACGSRWWRWRAGLRGSSTRFGETAQCTTRQSSESPTPVWQPRASGGR